MLHIVSSSPHSFDAQALFDIVTNRDVVLFVQDGVYCLVSDVMIEALTKNGATLYVLINDINARGLAHLYSSKVITVDYGGYVDLTAEHTPQVMWR